MRKELKKKSSVLIIGAGPSGVACAKEATINGFKVTIVEAGLPTSQRICPAKTSGNGCVGCPTCAIMQGFGGAGAFSDGKFTMPQEPGLYHIGGDLPRYIGYNRTNELIMKRFNDDLQHGGVDNIIKDVSTSFVQQFDQDLKRVGLFRAHADVNHIGTSRVQAIYSSYLEELQALGVNILFKTRVKELIISDKTVLGVITDSGKKILADNVVVATGRSGASWFSEMVKKYHFPRKPAVADFGFRVELPSKYMEEINKNLYEAKILGRYEDMTVRMFCTNPDGAVVTERTDDIPYVNGHSDTEPLSNNTNFAVLVTTPRYTQEMVKKMAKRIATSGNGQPLVQRYSDLLNNKASTIEDIQKCSPTLTSARPGNLVKFFPKEELNAIHNYMDALLTLLPGLTREEILFYALEAKFCHPGIELTSELRVKGWNLFVIGDAGVTHGLASAGASGLYIVPFFV